MSGFTPRLWARGQHRTSRLMGQEELSQTYTYTHTRTPRALSRSQHQVRNWAVMALTGRPFTTRSQVSPGALPA